ncbi:hypothetical protein Q4610_16460 [Sphingobium sp. HBC34]|uniref:Transposase n=1 Tax=Sphingobium cyanobacteriorum TaxID=3063954 RepID=A0ABT8ZQ23_9SPHN|nr:hypothetical protein [Sphingobium sp. HBC34]MDO7836640.1 hypothetical protein [Sphingobium sp. HBC34]
MAADHIDKGFTGTNRDRPCLDQALHGYILTVPERERHPHSMSDGQATINKSTFYERISRTDTIIHLDFSKAKLSIFEGCRFDFDQPIALVNFIGTIQ